jgi:pyruvate-ferredoxin/flavodoxin oxidoreductase
MARTRTIIDGNEAAASIAYRLSEVIAIYPITPSTLMGELADSWMASATPNLWGHVPHVIEMQSEGGAAGAVHGALTTGALTTTFTASQGLLLMIPNMYKIAGELTSAVFHVAARSLAAQGLSIFGDHSDVMAVRQTGWALLASSTVQEAHDQALIAHAATLAARLPIVHFFDGFRTSHELATMELLDDDDLRAMIDLDLVNAHRARGLTPERPSIRGTAQNPDVYFQARETVNPHYAAMPGIVQATMDRFAALTGRAYRLFDYDGAPDAERVIVVMGSGAETTRETVRALAAAGEKVGVVTVRLYRPFAVDHFLRALPPAVRAIAVLDRTKEPGSAGEPLYLDVVAALAEGRENALVAPYTEAPRVIGGRYGLSSKDFTPAMVKGIFDALDGLGVGGHAAPPTHFTIGINDDVSHTSLPYDPAFSIELDATTRCLFYGLGSDGTVGANKNSIKIIGESGDDHAPYYAQGYFVYDSKKSGSLTTSHLRFGPHPIHAPYLIDAADFVACHQFAFLERFDVLQHARPGAVFLLNAPYGPREIWNELPREVQATIRAKDLQLYVIDAARVAAENGMGGRINTVMQTCFFAISGVLPRDEAIEAIKQAIRKTYGKRGAAVIAQNERAVDATLAHLHKIDIAEWETSVSSFERRPAAPAEAPQFVREVLAPMIAGNGDELPVSALPIDGAYPTGTARWEKRNIALEIPEWDADLCIQCGKCSFVCPHAVIRSKVYEAAALNGAPESFPRADARFKEFGGWKYTLQVSPEDCTGCGLCVEVCPAKDKRQVGRKAINMAPQAPIRARENANWEHFLTLPDVERAQVNLGSIKNSQLMIPLFEFSGACSGCGETPYIKLLTQLFGDRLLIANATGCSSIYGGNLPTTPYTIDAQGRGPAWANSLFEDNAEFGLGMRLTLDQQQEQARALLTQLAEVVGAELAQQILDADQHDDAGIAQQRERVRVLKDRINTLVERSTLKVESESAPAMQSDGQHSTFNLQSSTPKELVALADSLVRKSVWIVGGDGWAYDIGYGGLDHVLASGRNVKVLVLDTEVYSNTGGQASKSTPRGAIAKFAARGKAMPKKDLGMIAMAYGSIYVARVAMGADDVQTLRAFQEAEAYDGPALIIAYSHCIAHGIDMRKGLEQQKLAVQSGHWPLYRYNPARAESGENPMTLDSKEPSVSLEKYLYNETRYRMLQQADPTRAAELLHRAEADVRRRWELHRSLAEG